MTAVGSGKINQLELVGRVAKSETCLAISLLPVLLKGQIRVL